MNWPEHCGTQLSLLPRVGWYCVPCDRLVWTERRQDERAHHLDRSIAVVDAAASNALAEAYARFRTTLPKAIKAIQAEEPR